MKRARYTRPLTITLTPELYSVIRQISDDRSTSMGEVVREILEKAFSESDSAGKFNQAEAAAKSSRRER